MRIGLMFSVTAAGGAARGFRQTKPQLPLSSRVNHRLGAVPETPFWTTVPNALSSLPTGLSGLLVTLARRRCARYYAYECGGESYMANLSNPYRLSWMESERLVANTLAKTFPGTGFRLTQVHPDRNWLLIEWTDGPDQNAVQQKANALSGGSSKHCVTHWLAKGDTVTRASVANPSTGRREYPKPPWPARHVQIAITNIQCRRCSIQAMSAGL